jgi:hypothetical protein
MINSSMFSNIGMLWQNGMNSIKNEMLRLRLNLIWKYFVLFQLMHHIRKNHRMLKQFKIITLAPTCFDSRRTHHQGALQWLAKTTKYVLFVLVSIDAVSVMAAYQPVVQACSDLHACTMGWYGHWLHLYQQVHKNHTL